MNKDTIIVGSHKFETLVAVTPEEQQRGLMFQEWPPPVMCFPTKRAGYPSFWMKNTPSPLDILFAHRGKIVAIAFGKPNSTELIEPKKLTDLVIELPHGTVKSLGIEVGDSVKAVFSTSTTSKLLKSG